MARADPHDAGAGPDTNAARFAVVEECRKMNHDTIIRGHRDADGRWSFTASE